LKPGDRILAIDGRETATWGDVAKIIEKSQGRAVTVRYLRGNEEGETTVQPQLTMAKNIFGEDVEAYKIGIIGSSNVVVRSLQSPGRPCGRVRVKHGL